jgi:Peptidase C39 family.
MIVVIILLACLCALALLSNYYVIPRKDVIDAGNRPGSYRVSEKNRIDTQEGNECASFAAAFILRHFGIEADGHANYKTFPRKMISGTIAPRGILKFFRRNGFSTCFYRGNRESLKAQLNKGIPVIVLIRVFADKRFLHYVPVVAYDEDFFYLAESLAFLKNSHEAHFSRKIKRSEFEQLWKTWVPLYQNTYFVVSRSDCSNISN